MPSTDNAINSRRSGFPNSISGLRRFVGLRTMAVVSVTAPTAPHSHSMLSTHRNALIYKRKSFLMTVEIRLSVR
jgi:hypothetical protein